MKRKPRNKMSKEVNLLYPINVEEFGSEKDPCFGKHNDPKAPECMRCGDCEICAVVQSQAMHKVRAEVESKQKFKDLELTPTHTRLSIKDIKRFIRTTLKTTKGQYIPIEELTQQVMASFDINSKKAKKLILSTAEKSTYIKFNKTKLKLKWDDKTS